MPTLLQFKTVDGNESLREVNAPAESSGFIRGLYESLGEEEVIDLRTISHAFQRLTLVNAERFIAIWDYLFTDKDGIQLATHISPEYMAGRYFSTLDELMEPTDVDQHEQTEYVDRTTRCGIEYGKKLMNLLPLPVLIEYLKLANFMDIQPMVALFSFYISKFYETYLKLDPIY